jgi:hypothetical protein
LFRFRGGHEPTPHELSRLTLEAYNQLRANTAEAARHARTLFLAHLSVNAYSLLTVITLDDKDFYGAGAKVKLPIIAVDVSTSAFFTFMPLLAFYVMLYFQVYLTHALALVEKLKQAERFHTHHPAFVPASATFRYPWIGFFAEEPGLRYFIARHSFASLAWGSVPTLFALCWWKLTKYDSTLALWMQDGPPPSTPYALACAATLTLATTWSWSRGLRPRDGLSWKDVALWVLAPVVVMATVYVAGRARSLQPVELGNAELSIRPKAGGEPTGVRLRGVLLRDASFDGSYLARADFTEAKLHRATFHKANLRGAFFRAAELDHAVLMCADLRGSILQQANLTDARLQGADLSGSLTEHAKFAGARYSTNTRFPKGFAPDAHGMLLVRAPDDPGCPPRARSDTPKRDAAGESEEGSGGNASDL